MTITQDKIDHLAELIEQSKNVVITAHKGPDGDSIGSSLGLFHYLTQFHDNVSICHPDIAPHFLHWMDGFPHIQTLDNNEDEVIQKISAADLIFSLDYNSPTRIGRMEQFIRNSEAKKVMIDHHRDPDLDFYDLIFSDITACSTSQLIYEIIDATNDLDKLNRQVAEALYTGIVTDTGSFRFSSTKPRTHKIAAHLIEKGVKHWEVHENIFDTNTLDRIQLVSYALLEKLEVLDAYKTAYISLDAAEQKKYNATKGDTEGLVNQALGVVGIKVAAFFKESEGIIKISFRSKGQIPVNELAKKHFGGGGHLNAAGGKFVGKIEDAIDKFVTILPKFVDEHKDLFN